MTNDVTNNTDPIDEVSNGDLRAVIETAQLAVKPEPLSLDEGSGLSSVQLPAGASHQIIDLEKYGRVPRRQRGTNHAHTVADFTRVLERHGDVSPTVWVDLVAKKLVGVVNDGTSAEPDFGDLRTVLELRHTPEWLHWAGKNGKWLDQTEFAQHLDEGLEEVLIPDGATLLELVESFHASTAANFSSTVHRDSGAVKFTYHEDVTAKAGKNGDLSVPTEFTLKLAPFVGEPKWEIKARFLYRPQGGSLKLGYKLDRPERVIEDSLKEIQTRVSETFPSTYLGTPAAAIGG